MVALRWAMLLSLFAQVEAAPPQELEEITVMLQVATTRSFAKQELSTERGNSEETGEEELNAAMLLERKARSASSEDAAVAALDAGLEEGKVKPIEIAQAVKAMMVNMNQQLEEEEHETVERAKRQHQEAVQREEGLRERRAQDRAELAAELEKRKQKAAIEIRKEHDVGAIRSVEERDAAARTAALEERIDAAALLHPRPPAAEPEALEEELSSAVLLHSRRSPAGAEPTAPEATEEDLNAAVLLERRTPLPGGELAPPARLHEGGTVQPKEVDEALEKYVHEYNARQKLFWEKADAVMGTAGEQVVA